MKGQNHIVYTNVDNDSVDNTPATPTPCSLRPPSYDRLNNVIVPYDEHKRTSSDSDYTFDSSKFLLLDNGSSITLINNVDFLHDLTHDFRKPYIAIKDHQLYPQAKGTSKLMLTNHDPISLTAYYVPEIMESIISLDVLEQLGIHLNSKTQMLQSMSGTTFDNYTKYRISVPATQSSYHFPEQKCSQESQPSHPQVSSRPCPPTIRPRQC